EYLNACEEIAFLLGVENAESDHEFLWPVMVPKAGEVWHLRPRQNNAKLTALLPRSFRGAQQIDAPLLAALVRQMPDDHFILSDAPGIARWCPINAGTGRRIESHALQDEARRGEPAFQQRLSFAFSLHEDGVGFARQRQQRRMRVGATGTIAGL